MRGKQSRATGLCAAGLRFEKVGMTSFVDEAEKPNRFVAYFVVDVKWKWLGPTTGKTVRAFVVTAFPADDLTNLSSDALT